MLDDVQARHSLSISRGRPFDSAWYAHQRRHRAAHAGLMGRFVGCLSTAPRQHRNWPFMMEKSMACIHPIRRDHIAVARREWTHAARFHALQTSLASVRPTQPLHAARQTVVVSFRNIGMRSTSAPAQATPSPCPMLLRCRPHCAVWPRQPLNRQRAMREQHFRGVHIARAGCRHQCRLASFPTRYVRAYQQFLQHGALPFREARGRASRRTD